MRLRSQWKTILFVVGLLASSVGMNSTSHAIIHDGETRLCGDCGGVGFSWFHRSKSNPTGGGGFSRQILDRTPISYEWVPGGLVDGTSRQVFNCGSSRIFESDVGGIEFAVDLWVDHAGNQTGSNASDLNVLSVRDDTVVNGGTHL